MIIEREQLTELEVRIYELLQVTRKQSTCLDKQVAACAVKNGKVIGLTYNISSERCQQKCNTTKDCAHHAETQLPNVVDADIYVSLFPCTGCQQWLFDHGAKHIYSFTKPHKRYLELNNITVLPDIAKVLLAFNSIDKQKDVIVGEMAELICEIMNSKRKDVRDTHIDEEYIDVTLQMHCLENIASHNPTDRVKKYNKLLSKFIPLIGDNNA
jgi:deoxycytidylate deaminase